MLRLNVGDVYPNNLGDLVTIVELSKPDGDYAKGDNDVTYDNFEPYVGRAVYGDKNDPMSLVMVPPQPLFDYPNVDVW